jgi:hypothetical protein
MTTLKLIITAAVILTLHSVIIRGQQNDQTHPIIEFRESCLIGAAQRQKWLDADHFGKAPQRGTFQVYTLNGPPREITVDKISEDGDCGGEWQIETANAEKEGIGIFNPTWKVMPRLPRKVDVKDVTYVKVVSDILKQKGIKRPVVSIDQAYKIDLDGDGADEVVIVANHYANGVSELTGVVHQTAGGDYTLVLVRRIVNGAVKNILVVDSVWLKANEGPLPRGNHLSAIADLNGDGVMELVLYSAYHEGSGSEVIEIRGAKASEVLRCACEH